MKVLLDPTLADKIAQLSAAQPYVWQLRLSQDDFRLLQQCLTTVANDNGRQALSTKEWAKPMLVYMAEWYKRCYQSGSRNELADGIDLEALWHNAGLNPKTYLYKDANGNNRWLYSIYVLGGLAIRHELGRGDKLRFLKALCRIYHGEDFTLENIDDSARAVAFRESISRRHSLYAYMRDILNGNLPFAPDDLTDAASDACRFVSVMEAANDEVLRVKYRLEWRVQFSPDDECMTRSIHLLFRPEEVGEGLHQYLRFDRLHLWGITHPENEKTLQLFVRFMDGERNVSTESMMRPLVTYVNHSVDGFVAFGHERGVTVSDVPTAPFDRIEIVMRDEQGREYIVQTQSPRPYMQLWLADDYGDVWTSMPQPQHTTVLLYAAPCRLAEESLLHDSYTLPFVDKNHGMSQSWHLTYIYDSVTLCDEHGTQIVFYNRIGHDQVTTHLYADTIRYVKGGLVRHCYVEDDDFDDELITDELPLIFGREDILVRHFATKDDIKDARPQAVSQAESVEYKQENGRYAPWTDHDRPDYGPLQLRIQVKGKPFLLKAYYLPRLNKEQPISRDFTHARIIYRRVNGDEAVLQDIIPMDGKCLSPTISLRYGTPTDYYEIEVFRPTLIKEIVIDGNLAEYRQDGETIALPYILKDRVRINDFSRMGYQSYDCAHIEGVFSNDFINVEGNPNVAHAALSAWQRDAHYLARLFDPLAPECLTICFGLSPEQREWESGTSLMWNYDCHTEPRVCSADEEPDFGIVFQDLRQASDLSCHFPTLRDNDPWAWDEVEVDYVKCFEVASQARTYFFLMRPLFDIMSEADLDRLLLQPLLARRDGRLTDDERREVNRLKQELGIDVQM